MGHKRDSQDKDPHSREKLGFSLFRRLKTAIFLFRKASLKKTEQVKELRKVGVVVLNTVVRVGIRKGDTPANSRSGRDFPGRPMVKTSPSSVEGTGRFNPWSGS